MSSFGMTSPYATSGVEHVHNQSEKVTGLSVTHGYQRYTFKRATHGTIKEGMSHPSVFEFYIHILG